jgi:hypothetical protein
MIPEHLHTLAESNLRKLDLHGINRDSIKTRMDALVAGEFYFSEIFTPEQITQVNRGITTEPDLYDQPKDSLATYITQFDPALILLRPEMVHQSDSILDFLTNNGFSPQWLDDIRVTNNQYWHLYKHAIVRPQARKSMPTRTITYTDLPSKLILFTDPHNRFNSVEQPLADGFVNEFKGVHASYQHNTLRGDLVYREALRLGLHTLTGIVSLATDPFRTLSHIIYDNDNYHNYLPISYRPLIYNSVGVHVPNSAEFKRDLCILLTNDQLTEIANIIF